MKKDDLVVLSYSRNPCYTQLTRYNKNDHGEVNLKKGTWEFRGLEIKLGESRSTNQRMTTEQGVIGIYDKTKIAHLENLVRAAITAVDYGNRINCD